MKTAEKPIFIVVWAIFKIWHVKFRFTNLGRFLDPPSGPESAQSTVCIAFRAFSESPKVDPSRSEKILSPRKGPQVLEGVWEGVSGGDPGPRSWRGSGKGSQGVWWRFRRYRHFQHPNKKVIISLDQSKKLTSENKKGNP